MHIPRTVMTTALVAVALGLGSPVMAQHHRSGGGGGQSSSRGAESHAAAPRASAPAPSVPAPAARPAPGGNNNVNNGYRGSPQRNQGYAVPRAYGSVQGGGAYHYNGNRNYAYGNGSHNNYAYHNGRAYYYHAPVHFYHPYYSFHPSFSIGFGIWAGYPVPYGYAYYDPYYYGAPYYAYPSPGYPSTPYPPSTEYPQSPYPQSPYPQNAPDPNSIGVQPGQAQANTGGLSFDITPSDAEVTIDGNFVGTVGQFTASSQPLGLSAGRHRVEVSAPGYRSINFDVNIIAGQVVPYQGSMERR
jgi:PEGA domain